MSIDANISRVPTRANKPSEKDILQNQWKTIVYICWFVRSEKYRTPDLILVLLNIFRNNIDEELRRLKISSKSSVVTRAIPGKV